MADNWEDRLAGHPAVKNAKSASNWEDRLRRADYTPPKKITDEGGTLLFGPWDTGIKTSPSVNNFLAGTGKAMVDLGRGIGQKLGMVSNADIEASRELDAPLMDTTAGKIGNFTGSVASTVPLMFVPGANTLAGAGVIGAASGFLQPSTSGRELATNTGLGAVAGVGGNVAGRVIGATVGGVKAAAQPLFAKGRQSLEADMIRRFTPNTPEALRNLAANGAELVPGSLPTAAEAAGSTGIAQLSKQIQQLSPEAKQAFFERAQQQNAARVAAVRSISGDEASRQAAVAARSTTTAPMYNAAQSAIVQADPALNSLMSRPSMQSAMGRAQKLSSETASPIKIGKDLPEQIVPSGLLDASGNPVSTVIPAQTAQYTGKGLQYLKMGLDDLLDNPMTSGIGAHEQRAITNTRQELVDWLKQTNPAYAQADAKFAELSRPINQMDVGDSLAKSLIPAINDFGASGNLRASGFAQALRNGDATAQRVLGWPGATMDSVMEPQQMSILQALGRDLARSSDGVALARAPGSDTAQNIASQNIIKNIMGPLGLPEGLASNTLMRTIMRPAQWAASLAEPQILSGLGQTLLSPEATAAALQRAQMPSLTTKLAEALRAYGGPAGIIGQQSLIPSVQAPQE